MKLGGRFHGTRPMSLGFVSMITAFIIWYVPP
jgi:hypothetical protein